MIRIERAVVADDQHVVLGHREIELERRDADRERRLECRERVLRRKPARAAMALQIKSVRRRGEQQDKWNQPSHQMAMIPQPRSNPTTPCARMAAEAVNISA